MENPLLSIVVLSYRNTSLVLRRALRSIREQTEKNLEVILVNANAKDDEYSVSLEEDVHLCDEFGTVSTLLGCPSRKDFAQVINNGASYAKGKYITFLFAESAIHPEFAAKCTRALEEHPEADVAVCQAWGAFDDAFSNEFRSPPQGNSQGDVSLGEHYLGESIYDPSQLVFRRDVFVRLGGFDQHVECLYDYDMWLRTVGVSGEKVVRLPDKLLCSYQPESQSHTKRPSDKAIGYLQLYDKHKSYFKSNPDMKTELFGRVESNYRKSKHFTEWLRYLFKYWLIRIRYSMSPRVRKAKKLHGQEKERKLFDSSGGRT